MPRNSSGTYTLPQASYVAGTTITSTAMNSNLSDIATALTQSLATTGVSTMTGPIIMAAGTAAAPSLVFTGSLGTGLYQTAANQIGVAISGALVATWAAGSKNAGTLTMAASNAITDCLGNLVYGLPVGVVMPYAGATAPNGFLLAYGQTVSQTTYASLYTVCSTTYGSNAGGNFTLPDLRGRAPFGLDNMGGVAANRITNAGSGITGTTLGANGGSQNKSLVQANVPNYTLTVNITDPQHLHGITHGNTGGGGSFSIAGGSAGANNTDNTNNASTGISASAPSGGSGTAVQIMNPTLIMTYIIYTGVFS